jgi:hypothetical protein
MWYLSNIPKIMHCYWGGRKLPYLRYLTLESFHKYNPDWEIRYYYPLNPIAGHSWSTIEQKYDETWENWVDKIDSNVIEVQGVNFAEATKGMSEVHRSDYLRWQLLSTVGGLWSDMDIIYTKPIDNLYINIPENKDKETIVCICKYGHSVGFLMGSANNATFKRMAEQSLVSYSSAQYQCMGSALFNKLYPTIESIPNCVNLSMDVLYAYDANHVKELFSSNNLVRFTNNTIGVHWYAGNHIAGKYLNDTNGGLNTQAVSIIDKILRHEG